MVDSVLTEFMILASCLEMLMTLDVAFFYRGGARLQENILNVIIQRFVSMGWTSFLWFAFGYALCFSGGHGQIIGNFFIDQNEFLFQ